MFLEQFQSQIAESYKNNVVATAPILNLSRRHVLAGGGFLLGVSLLPACTPKPEVTASAETAMQTLFVGIAPDESIKITVSRSEMGQQTWTAMTQIIADELDAPWDNIDVVQAIGHPKYGDQNTDGSTSVRNHMTRFREAGATARTMLEQAAATLWEVDPETCHGILGEVHGPDGKKTSYGKLAALAADVAVPAKETLKLKPREKWRYIGKDKPSLTVPKIVKGEGQFGIDVQVPGMVHAVIARAPQLFGTVKSVDDSAALAVPGVLKVITLDTATAPAMFKPMGGVAVIATDTWAAIKGREALKVTWGDSPHGDYDSDQYAKDMMETARRPGKERLNRGDVMGALKTADKTVVAEYYAPHLSHSPMEPPSATAVWTDGSVECWGCVQAPQGARDTVAGVCGVEADKVTINVTWLGGGFGRKSKPDFVAEAALLAREMGKPVKVTWTREDDLQHGYYHAASAQRLEGGLDKDGKATAWLHRTVFPTINSTFSTEAKDPSGFELSLGASDNPFEIANMRLETGVAPAKVRIGWLRSVCNVFHAYAVQSFAAEMAHAAGRDQKDYLLELFGADRLHDPSQSGAEFVNYGGDTTEHPIDVARLKAVTEKVADMAGWGRAMPEGSGLGIAVHRSFLSYVATVVEAQVSADGTVRVPKFWVCVDAGTVVNPGHTKAQMEGGTIFGLSNALYGDLSAKNGAIVQRNFPDWRVMRMNEAPVDAEVHIMESNAPPGGVGEPGTPPAAPALANAIFAATGHRVRNLPILGQSDRIDLTEKTDT